MAWWWLEDKIIWAGRGRLPAHFSSATPPLPATIDTMTTAKGMIGALVENPRVLSLANWAWGSSDIIAGGSSSSITPSSCLESLPLLTSSCLSRLVAKCVGICIILASCANKAPVIRNVIGSGSVAGLSVVAIYGEIALYSNAALYNFLRGNPFSAYGETLTVLLQTMVVAALLWRYDARRGWRDAFIALVAYCAYLFVVFFGEREREGGDNLFVVVPPQFFSSLRL